MGLIPCVDQDCNCTLGNWIRGHNQNIKLYRYEKSLEEKKARKLRTNNQYEADRVDQDWKMRNKVIKWCHARIDWCGKGCSKITASIDCCGCQPRLKKLNQCPRSCLSTLIECAELCCIAFPYHWKWCCKPSNLEARESRQPPESRSPRNPEKKDRNDKGDGGDDEK